MMNKKHCKKQDKFKSFFENLNKTLSDPQREGVVPLTDSLIDDLVESSAAQHRKNLIHARNHGAFFNKLTGDLVFPLEVYDV